MWLQLFLLRNVLQLKNNTFIEVITYAPDVMSNRYLFRSRFSLHCFKRNGFLLGSFTILVFLGIVRW